jgi:hypothetical protein
MPQLDHYGAYLIAAFGVTTIVLAAYGLYLRSRLLGARRRAAALAHAAADPVYSERNVSAAAPIVTTAQPASRANGPTAS